MGRLDGWVVLLSGGASGIGGATAARLAGDGAAVVIGDVAADAAKAIASAITKNGGQALGVPCDLRDEKSVISFVDTAVLEFGGRRLSRPQRAAWSHPRLDTDAGDIDLNVWQRVIDTNTRRCCWPGTPSRT